MYLLDPTFSCGVRLKCLRRSTLVPSRTSIANCLPEVAKPVALLRAFRFLPLAISCPGVSTFRVSGILSSTIGSTTRMCFTVDFCFRGPLNLGSKKHFGIFCDKRARRKYADNSGLLELTLVLRPVPLTCICTLTIWATNGLHPNVLIDDNARPPKVAAKFCHNFLSRDR